MKIRIQLDQLADKTLLLSSIHQSRRSGAVLALFLILAVLALPGSMGKFSKMKEMIVNAASGENVTRPGSVEIAASLEERLYWGRVVAATNPSLTMFEINDIGSAILKYSSEYGLSPNVIVAIIKVESSGRVSAVSPKGAQGLMQVMPFWKEELGIDGTLFDIDNNIRAGTHILSEYIRKHGYEEGISKYYRGNLPIDGQGYYGKLQKAMQT